MVTSIPTRGTADEALTHRVGISIPARYARPFEPAGLGPLYPAFAALLRRMANKRQSEILQQIKRERESIREDTSTESLAYRLVLSVLADYIAFGNYPVVRNGHCFLLPVLESQEIPEQKKRHLAQHLFRMARDRALADRNQLPWIASTAQGLRDTQYDPTPVLRAMESSPPPFRLVEARNSTKILDARGLWRAVRVTWSMGVESSAPGREVAFVGVDDRYPNVPLGIVQFRNVVPEIVARDRWLGVTAGFDASGSAHGYLRYVIDQPEGPDRLQGTRDIFTALMRHLNASGLPATPSPDINPRVFADIADSERVAYNDLRRNGVESAKSRLLIIKRAETAADIIKGIRAIDTALTAKSGPRVFADSPHLLRGLNAGLRKIWHYHMGFVAIEMSICGASPPFGPLRLGKLLASVGASDVVLNAWGADRPLGEIAAGTYLPSVRDAVPHPGPVCLFTSGLYPPHSAQYSRLQVGNTRWRKIGETLGYGSFHVSADTRRLASQFNATVDGYRHITRAFGEGASPRFREVSRAISRLELPDLLRHEMARPLYVLPLVDDPQSVLLGWSGSGTRTSGYDLADLTKGWWERWVAPRSRHLISLAERTPDLPTVLDDILRSVGADARSAS